MLTNKKIEIWKRKLAKNVLKQKMAVWNRLKDTTPPKPSVLVRYTGKMSYDSPIVYCPTLPSVTLAKAVSRHTDFSKGFDK